MRKCKHCNTKLPEEKKQNIFCDSSCSASFNNKGVKRNFSNKPQNKCMHCNIETSNSTYCSLKCQQNYRQKIAFQKMDDTGVLASWNNNRITKNGKKYLINLRGYKCEDCLNTTWKNQPIPLEMHHKNGDPDDNIIENVQLLCPNCHSCTPTSKGKNKSGNGRWSKRNKTRRARYAEGKSS